MAKRDAEMVRVSADGEPRGPELPDNVAWPAQTLKWWDTWRRSPQAVPMTDTDWDFLLDTALLHAAYWQGDMKVAPELRLRVAKFGATVEDRQRLRLQVDGESEKPVVSRSTDAARRNRLLRLVNDDATSNAQEA